MQWDSFGFQVRPSAVIVFSNSASCGRLATPQCATNVGAITVQFSSLIDATGVLVAILRMHAAELRLQVRYTQVEQIKVGHYLEIQAPGGTLLFR